MDKGKPSTASAAEAPIPKISIKDAKKHPARKIKTSRRAAEQPTRASTRIKIRKDPVAENADKINTKSVYTVGFKQGTRPAMMDLTLFRNEVLSKTNKEKAVSVIATLNNMLKNIPTSKYNNSPPEEQFLIIQQLTEAYNFAWNEACEQLKGISEEHALVFAQMKKFYLTLFEKYPLLIHSFQEQIRQISEVSYQKDQHIHSVLKELQLERENRDSCREYIYSLQKELDRIKERKEYYKKTLNSLTMDVETYKTSITEIRCQFAKVVEENERLKTNIEDRMPMTSPDFCIEQNADRVDIATDAVSISRANSDATIKVGENRDKKKLQRVDSVNRVIADIEPQEIDTSYISLRHTIFSFVIEQPPSNPTQIAINIEGEFKKFYWIFPKVCTLFINMLSMENPSNPFTSFEQVVREFVHSQYKTSYLSQQIMASFIQSAEILEQTSKAIFLFNRFAQGDYDFQQFRFFNTALEFSICYSEPDIADLLLNELIQPEEAVVTITIENATMVHQSMFPFWQPCEGLLGCDKDQRIDYWEFLEMLIQEFQKVRKHIWAVLKHALLLSDCVDLQHITQKNFQQFTAIVFPDIPPTQAKSNFKALLVRNNAMDRQNDDMIDFESIVYFCVQKDQFVINIMMINTIPTFTQKFYDWNASILEILAFIVKRLTLYIPAMEKSLTEHVDILREYGTKIRATLLMADISGSIANYRKLLHIIDGYFVDDFTRVSVSNNSTEQHIKRLIKHLEDRENVVGITTE